MGRKIHDYIKYTKLELENYIKIHDTCIQKVNKKIHLNFPPYGLGCVKATILRLIAEKKIGCYDQELKGIILDIRNIKILGNNAAIRFDNPTLHFNIQADCYIFIPKIGSIVRGLVKHISPRQIGVIIYRVFNVSIRFSSDLYNNSTIELNSEIEFQIKNFDLENIMPYIEGELVAKCMPLNTGTILNKHSYINSDSDENENENENENEKKPIFKKPFEKVPLSKSSSSSSDSEEEPIVFSEVFHLKPDQIEKLKKKKKKNQNIDNSEENEELKLKDVFKDPKGTNKKKKKEKISDEIETNSKSDLNLIHKKIKTEKQLNSTQEISGNDTSTSSLSSKSRKKKLKKKSGQKNIRYDTVKSSNSVIEENLSSIENVFDSEDLFNGVADQSPLRPYQTTNNISSVIEDIKPNETSIVNGTTNKIEEDQFSQILKKVKKERKSVRESKRKISESNISLTDESSFKELKSKKDKKQKNSNDQMMQVSNSVIIKDEVITQSPTKSQKPTENDMTTKTKSELKKMRHNAIYLKKEIMSSDSSNSSDSSSSVEKIEKKRKSKKSSTKINSSLIDIIEKVKKQKIYEQNEKMPKSRKRTISLSDSIVEILARVADKKAKTDEIDPIIKKKKKKSNNFSNDVHSVNGDSFMEPQLSSTMIDFVK